MDLADSVQVAAQRAGAGLGKHGASILATLPVPDVDLASVQVEILHPQLERLRQTQAASVQKLQTKDGMPCSRESTA